jgi:ribosomal-protein-alanine N-acetyltransferase
LIDYKINTGSKDDLLNHLEVCDSRFLPELSQRVNLDDYVQKLSKYAEIIEAWEASILVGVISVYLNNKASKVGFISSISVLAEFEKKGIASDLIKIMKVEAIKQGFLEIHLEVYSKNDRIITFYKKHGFHPISQSDDVVTMCINLKEKE